MCPRSYSPTTFPSISSISRPFCLLPIISTYLSDPFSCFPGRLAWEQQCPQLLPARPPAGKSSLQPHAQGRRAARQVCTGGGYTWYSARLWRLTWAWGPAQSPGELLSLPRLILLRCSCLSNVPHSWPPWVECPPQSGLGRTGAVSVFVYLPFSWCQQPSGFNLEENIRTRLSCDPP